MIGKGGDRKMCRAVMAHIFDPSTREAGADVSL